MFQDGSMSVLKVFADCGGGDGGGRIAGGWERGKTMGGGGDLNKRNNRRGEIPRIGNSDSAANENGPPLGADMFVLAEHFVRRPRATYPQVRPLPSSFPHLHRLLQFHFLVRRSSPRQLHCSHPLYFPSNCSCRILHPSVPPPSTISSCSTVILPTESFEYARYVFNRRP